MPVFRSLCLRAPLNVPLTALLCLVAFTPPTSAQELDQYGRWVNGVSEPWFFGAELDKAEVSAAQTRWKLIEEENGRAAGGEWAGDYFVGDETHGSFLRWAPGAGFVLFKVNKCAAQVDDFSYGRVVVSPTLVMLVPERAMRPRGAHGHGHHPSGNHYVPVKFRGERLLIPEGEMSDFGDYVAGLGQFNRHQFFSYIMTTSFFSQFGGSEAEPAAAPVVPPGYERFLKRPLTGRVVSVGRRSIRRDYGYENEDGTGGVYNGLSSLARLTVNVGRAHGAKRGMILRALATGEDIRLTRVGKLTSEGLVVRSLGDNGQETYFDHETNRDKVYPTVVVGWRLTTSPF
ncbi:MAG TPA: hypothetical protein VF240_13415 [Pyrinomonadaceae bacterium]